VEYTDSFIKKNGDNNYMPDNAVSYPRRSIYEWFFSVEGEHSPFV